MRENSDRLLSAATIDGMTWHQFERLVGDAFRQ